MLYLCVFISYFLDFSVPVLMSGFGGFHGPVVLDDLLCDGNESSLLNCTVGHGSHQCSNHSEDAGVKCSEAYRCEEGSMRLIPRREWTGEQLYLMEGELQAFEFINDEIQRGRLEVCKNGGWWSICYESTWHNEYATLACRQLGFSSFGESNDLVEIIS